VSTHTAQQPGPDLLAALKDSARTHGPSLGIAVGRPPVATLRPVGTRPHSVRASDVEALTAWRNRFVTAFLTEFVATEERTRRWLMDVVGPSPTKILFMLDDMNGNTFGYMGLDYIDWERQYGEADAIVRGGDAPRGTMRIALTDLMTWAEHTLGLQSLGVRVRSDNPALAFYRSIGFADVRTEPLVRTEEAGMIRYSPSSEAQNTPVGLVHMRWTGHSAGEAGRS
jgi:hypothetical protein